ncbi:MAG: metal-binding protein [Legionella sp.]|nr:MAG: metal-binding protein [Legionella sp.]PJD99119.1 MAG: metal-binding protein [Legionella sp.]
MLHLSELANQGTQHSQLTITNRIPSFIVAPCHVEVSYQVEKKEDYFLLSMQVEGKLTLCCQRCMQEFDFIYSNPTTLAVVRSEERAEQLLAHYECIVSSNWKVALEELVVDELHLYAPQFHSKKEDCDKDINQFLIEK